MGNDKRRDPRQEKIARNRLHPLHRDQAILVTKAILATGSGVKRKYPHQIGFTGPAGIKRIDRLYSASAELHSHAGDIEGKGQAGNATASRQIRDLPLHRVENPAFYIAVVPELGGGRLTSADKDMLGLAQKLAEQNQTNSPEGQGAVIAIIFNPVAEDLSLAGADRVLDFSALVEGYQPEVCTALLKEAHLEYTPSTWLFADHTMTSADLGRRLAAALKIRAATNVQEFGTNPVTSIEPDQANRSVYCLAGAGGEEFHRPMAQILLVNEELENPVNGYRCEAQPVSLQTTPDHSSNIEDLGNVAVDPSMIPLAETGFILSGGNGVKNWDLFHKTAQLLGATEGASRVAVDDGHMPRERQVGATGTYVTAQVYVAVGISGAIQHLQGMTKCDTVIAINDDPACDMVSRADLSVIGDSGQIMQALVTRLGATGERGAIGESGVKEELDDAV